MQSRWNDGADILTFEYPTKNGPRFENGSTVIFTYGGANIFYGFLFKTKQDKKKYTCTAYDQLRYFKANYTLMRQIETLDSFLNRVAYTVNDRVRLGTVDKTEIKLGKYFFDNKELLDMLYQSIKDNLLLNGYQYTLRDNFGALDLRDTYDLRLPLVLGDNSLATDFSYTRSIDDSTYNYIKVAKDDQAAGVRNTYIAQDSKTIGTDTEGWGRLILYHKVSGDLNDEQLAQRANQLLYLHNEETRTLTIDAIGDTRIRGGSGVKVEIASAGLDMWAVADSVNHEFTGKAHTMKIDLIYGEKELWELRS
ncbi:MAG: hypothetical protein LBV27_09015 [Oscillospiraceae bacterium]|nr:hypothetical protein [Oscillospiraceae bacterium]